MEYKIIYFLLASFFFGLSIILLDLLYFYLFMIDYDKYEENRQKLLRKEKITDFDILSSFK